ncbi:MAG: hypothetical protein CME65_15890 [Halobacteriovoraceae bacterium]|nr:hypothetical protein [Halobacteriovoraceae bacterium]|tara:strand:+ start:26267 stop:26938 length:672 start_codon:yes stop_codon:yes gene_type:complete
MGEFLLAKFLRGTREKIGLNQEAMAEVLEVSARTYQRIEAGKSQLNAASFIRFLKKIDDDVFFAYMNSLHGSEQKGILSIDAARNYIHNMAVHRDESPKLYGLVMQDKRELEKRIPGPIVGIWEWDFENEAKYWSPEMYEIYGLENGYGFSPEEVMERIYEEDRASIYNGMENLLVHSIPYTNQHRTILNQEFNFIVNSRGFLISYEQRYIVVGYSKAFKFSK